jgi:hypothetical protein
VQLLVIYALLIRSTPFSSKTPVFIGSNAICKHVERTGLGRP